MAEEDPKFKFQELAERTSGIWWAPAMNRYSDQTGVAHAVHGGGALCGAKPYSMGGSFRTAEEAGCHECKRCQAIIHRAKSALVTNTTYYRR